MKKLMLAALLSGLCLSAADVPVPNGLPATVVRSQAPEHRASLALWKASAATLLSANAVDTASSWNKRELNPVLSGNGGTFGGRGALLKLGIVGSVVVVEYLALRRHPSRSLAKSLAFINFGDAAVTGAVAGRNFGIAGR